MLQQDYLSLTQGFVFHGLVWSYVMLTRVLMGDSSFVNIGAHHFLDMVYKFLLKKFHRNRFVS